MLLNVTFIITLLLILCCGPRPSLGYGFDAGTVQGACARQYRDSRDQNRPPCDDLSGVGYCTTAGATYPWHAVKRFVRENQGLMRRMYGDQRHGLVLHAELYQDGDGNHDVKMMRMIHSTLDKNTRKSREHDFNNNEELFGNDLWYDGDDVEEASKEEEPRFLRDNDDDLMIRTNVDVLNTKFVYSEEPGISVKLGDLPHFRPNTNPLKYITTTTTAPSSSAPSIGTTTTSANLMNHSTKKKNSYSKTSDIEDNSTMTSTDADDHDDGTTTTPGGTSTTTTITTAGDSDETTLNTKLFVVSKYGTTVSSKPPKIPTTSTTSSTTSKPTTIKSGTILFQDMDNERIKVHHKAPLKDGFNACPVKEEIVAPFWANNTRGDVLALLNMYPFEQYVHWEKCTGEHKQMHCRDGCRCEQQYRLHRLLAYDPNNECRGIFSDWFRFPSCCVCKCYASLMSSGGSSEGNSAGGAAAPESRVTSRSPRIDANLFGAKVGGSEEFRTNQKEEHAHHDFYINDWYIRKNRAIFAFNG